MSVTGLLFAVALATAPQEPSSTPAAAVETAVTPAPTAPPSSERTWGFGFDRVDILSEAPGTFLNWDLPMFGVEWQVKTLRFLQQVTVVYRLPWEGFHMNLSIATQSLTYEHRIAGGLFVTGGVQTRLLFPSGANLGVAYRVGVLRVGLSASMTTGGSWSGPAMFVPQFLPALGIGIGVP